MFHHLTKHRINAKIIESMNHNRSLPLPVQPWQPELQRAIDLQSQINLAKSELSDAVIQRSQTPATATRELQEKDAKIESLTAKLYTREAQFAQLEAELRNKDIQLAQQAATIRIHSEAISKHHDRPYKYASQPFMLPSQIANLAQGQQALSQQSHGYGQQQQTQSPYNRHSQTTQPPQAFGTGSSNTLPTKWGVVSHALPHDPFISPQTQSRVVANSRGSPVPVDQMKTLTIKEPTMPGNGTFNTPLRKQQQAIGVQEQGDTPSTSHSSDAFALVPRMSDLPPARTASQASSNKKKTAEVPTMDAAKEAKMTESFQALLDEVVSYAYKHINTPSTQGDDNIPVALKTRLLGLATKTTASRIMANQNTRYFLIAKLILDWIVKEVLCESTFVGYDSKVDTTVRSMRGKIWADHDV